jgi:hypothetical protein
MDFANHSSQPTAFTQTDSAVSPPPPDASKIPPGTMSQNSEESLGDGETESPELEHSEDEEGNADVNSDCSSTFEYEQEPFETHQHKVLQLCRDIGYGEPAKIERRKGGSFNRIIGLEFASPKKLRYILHIPQHGTEFDESQDIKDQVATLDYVLQHLPVTSAAAFDSTQNNVLASAYVLQERIPGVLLEDVFYDLPLAEKLQIATKIAELMIRWIQSHLQFRDESLLMRTRQTSSISIFPLQWQARSAVTAVPNLEFQRSSLTWKKRLLRL